MVGKYNAGPAKLAVVASAMQGTYTGSAVANVVGTGSITIPLMKKVGYDPDFAAAVESAASTGGQIMPPIMGAAAFIMADFLGVPYLTVAKAALIPAFLYFLAVYIIVDLEGRKVGLLPVGDVPKFKKVILEGGHLLIPIFLLIWMLGAGFSMMRAGFVLFISTLVICFLKKGTRVSPRKLFNILETGFKDACSVVMICATAGLIIGSIMMTGLGLKISQLVLAMAAGHLWLALMFTMVVALIMGMGMPSVAVYVVLSALLGHGLSVLGTSLLAAHLFMFYFGVISGITPPVAVSAYAGAAIAKSDPWKTGWTAFRFALSGFIVPFCFIYGPPLLMQGSWLQIMQATVTAGLGVFALSVAVEGWFLTSLRNWPVRATLMGAAILMLHTGGNSDLIGISILAVIICFQIMRANKWKGLRKRMRILVFRNSKP
jgi:TRAP transporter 4TM/12TM fusion protein